jgi:phosphoribosylanthranilate isomerase
VTAPVHIKICGITSIEDADRCLAIGASAIGCNLIPSSVRVIDVEMARRIVEHVGERALVVLVVADLGVTEMRELVRRTGARCLQLHGDEPPEVVGDLLPHAYKAMRIGSPADVVTALAFPGEHLLADAKVPGKLGGTGQLADWDLCRPIARQRRLTLAGGLTPDNVRRAIERVRPYCVDVASGVEVAGSPRRKDPDKLLAFRRAVLETAP